jgi:hypothetical protein
MRTILILLLLINAIDVAAQCKYRVNEKDEFTGDRRIVVRKQLTLNAGSGMWFEPRVVGDSYFLDMTITGLAALTDEAISEGNLLKIKLANGETFELPANNTFYPESIGGVWLITCSFDASREMIEKFGKEDMTLWRFMLRTTYYDMEIKPNHKKRIREAINCLLAAT